MNILSQVTIDTNVVMNLYSTLSFQVKKDTNVDLNLLQNGFQVKMDTNMVIKL